MKKLEYGLLIALLLLCVSCTRGPNTQFIEGIVTLDGVPAERATVNFLPKSPSEALDSTERPLLASGVTDAQGYYRLSSVMGGKFGGGTTMGEYKVTLVKKEQTNKPIVKDDRPVRSIRPVYKYHIPEKFEKRGTSEIEVTVTKGKNRFNFDLQSDGSFEIKK